MSASDLDSTPLPEQSTETEVTDAVPIPPSEPPPAAEAVQIMEQAPVADPPTIVERIPVADVVPVVERMSDAEVTSVT